MSPVPRAFASFLAALLVLIPLPWHWRARNVPTLSLVIWLAVLNIAHGINVLVWWENVEIRLLIWCDIVSKLVIGANMALPAACFCLAMRLEGIAAVRHVKTSQSDKHRRMLVDIAICFGVPCVYMALHYVVQGHRFDIMEDFGCQPESYVSLPEFFLMWFVPILSCLGTFIFGGMAFMHFFRRRAIFARHLAASNTGLTPSRYFRLMTMSLALVIWDLVVFSLTLSFNYRNGLRPWTGWADVHSNWLHINQFPLIIIPKADRIWLYFVWWTVPVTAYLFFAFFAFGRDASLEYGTCLRWIRHHVLRQNLDDKTAAKLGSFSQSSVSSPFPPKLPHFSLSGSALDYPLSPAQTNYSTLDWPETPSTHTSARPVSCKYPLDKTMPLHYLSSSSEPELLPPYPPSPTTSGTFPPPATPSLASSHPSPVVTAPPIAATREARVPEFILHARTPNIV